MGWLIENRSEHFQLLGCVIGLDPEHDDNRISTTADGVHIANTNGKFRISGCDFSFMGDDDVNVHDNIATVTDKLDEKRLRFTPMQTILQPATLPFSAAKALTDSVFRQRLHPLKAKSLHSIKNCPIILSRTVSFQTAASTAEITLSAATISMKTEQEDCFFKAITDFVKATGSTKSWQIRSKSSWIFRPDFGLKARV